MHALASSAILVLVALPQELDAALLGPHALVRYTGVGKVNAAYAAAKAIREHAPQLVINFGSAGRVAPCPQGLVEVASVLQRDMNAEPLAPRGDTPFQDGDHCLHSGHVGVVCGTGDSFVTAPDPWFATRGVHLVDMELYAVASVCARENVAWRSIKFVSDDANGDSAQDWQANVRRGEQLFVDWFLAQRLPTPRV
jgi:adenosylhomocysteine nucleosidase